jgi:hypothetical protein
MVYRSYAANFVSSFQGNDPRYLKASSCWCVSLLLLSCEQCCSV